MVRDKVDLLMISETKLDSSFQKAQFYMKSYSKSCRLDKNNKGGGIILYVSEDIPSKLINASCIDHDKEYFLVELNRRKQKWLIICNYNLHKAMIKGCLEYISKEIDSHSSKYDNFLLLDDFNSEPTEEAMKSLCQIYNVMVRSKLRKKFLKSRSESDKKAYNKQRNKCVSLLRKTNKAYYSNLNLKDIP